MSRALLITISASVVCTTATVLINLLLDTTDGPAHFAADLLWSVAIASWLIVAMVWCTERIEATNRGGWRTVGGKVDHMESSIDARLGLLQARLETVEDVIEDLDHERIQADAMVVSIFKNRKKTV